MSTSPLGVPPPSSGRDASNLRELAVRLHSALFCANECMRRAGDQCQLDDLAHFNSGYADRQLMLASEYIDKARVALELISRVVHVPDDEKPETSAKKRLDELIAWHHSREEGQ